jgi:hypothetical protein
MENKAVMAAGWEPGRASESEFQLPTEVWLVQGFEENLKALKAGVPMPSMKEAKLRDEDSNQELEPSSPSDPAQASMYELAIVELDGLRDDLISKFGEYRSDNRLFKVFEDAIHRVEKSILSLGGAVEEFNPLEYMSGLGGENEPSESLVLTNALKVVENTKKHYRIHNILSIQAKLVKDKPAVLLQVQGKDESGDFKVVGAVVSKDDFSGNEAIDYVRHEGKGHLSVKSFKSGKWNDISSEFHIGTEDR